MPQLRLERGAPVATRKEELQAGLDDPGALDAPYGKLKPGPGKSPADVARNQRLRIQGAMLEILADQGYDDITVRKLAQRAGVSTRAFYQCYSSKEECFLSIHELIARRLLLQMAASQVSAEDPEERIRRTIGAFLRELGNDPRAARLMLIDVHTAGPNAQAQARRALRSIETRVSDSFGGPSFEGTAQQLIAEGVAAGLVGTVRPRCLSEQEMPLPDLSRELSLWALAYQHPSLVELDELGFDPDHQYHATWFQPPNRSSGARGKSSAEASPNGDVRLFLAAVAKLVAVDDPKALSTRNILEMAGLPRRAFNANFASLEDCVVTAQEVRVGEAIASAKLASGNRPTSARRVVCAVAVLCAELVQDPVFAGLCFGRLAADSSQRISCHERIRAHIADLIECAVEASPNGATSRLRSEASVAACWGVLQNEITARGTVRLARLAPALAYLILAPAVGAAEAFDTIRKEYGFHEKQPGRST